ncbi:hypothetical protein, partial [Smaragdicoccus niigatensis]
MSADLTAEELLELSDRLVAEVVKGTRGLWPRATTYLVRMAFESTLDEYWMSRVPAMVACTRHSQLLALDAYASVEVGGRARAVWGALSSACHYSQYDLAPTAGELRGWRE